MRFPVFVALAALAGQATLTIAVHAEDQGRTHRCASVIEAAARLACYDEAFGTPADAGSRAGSDASTALERFGFTKAERQARYGEIPRETGPQSIDGTIAHLRRHPTGPLIITLENGHVWMQADTNVNARLRTGDRVTIRRAALGSFELVTPTRIALRVRRVE